MILTPSCVGATLPPFSSGFDLLYFFLRFGDSLLLFLLENVQDVNGIGKSDRIDSPGIVRAVILDDLQHASAPDRVLKNGGKEKVHAAAPHSLQRRI